MGLVGGVINDPEVGTVLSKSGAHAELHGGVLAKDDIFVRNGVGFQKRQKVGDVVAAVGGFCFQVVSLQRVAVLEVGLEDLGFRFSFGWYVRIEFLDRVAESLRSVPYSADDDVGLGNFVFDGLGKRVPSRYYGAAEEDHNVSLAEAVG